MAWQYRRLVVALQAEGTQVVDQAPAFAPLPLVPALAMTPYPHQQAALAAWRASSRPYRETQQDPSRCSEHNMVYYDTHDTYISLTGGSSGCGILLVDGDLDVHGDFSWYGPVVITGSVTFTGGGNKQVTGSLLAGGSANADLVGGNADVVFCSTAITNQTQSLPLVTLSWHEP